MSALAQAPLEGPQAPVLVISDSTDDDPVGLRTSPVPCLHLPSPLFSTEEYHRAPLVLLDDRSYTGFTLRHMPHRRGLIIVLVDGDDGTILPDDSTILVDPDDSTIYPRAAAIGAEAVIRPEDSLNWLHLRLHDATDCRYAHWEALLADGPTDPPPPASS
ncbi:hypothetical protein [Streptomyces malaysiensis]|uniref:Uncharacterized protein n=1 Tax=Streptomyces malaysiensis subsp. samsunensis TaxID=459658 RepID=A0A9X2S1E4_STRMQ|nr:hypothetical protein [Streptomyces samsunensis]MCQ8836114.1 hypothetical protein [Streptomyces samsunensis]